MSDNDEQTYIIPCPVTGRMAYEGPREALEECRRIYNGLQFQGYPTADAADAAAEKPAETPATVSAPQLKMI